MLKEQLKINEWLELIKEDKNLNGAYICISQYLYLDEKEKQEIKKQLEEHKNIYIKKVNNFLAENVEPDPEDLYMAELEQRAMDCELMEMQQKEFIKYMEDYINEMKTATVYDSVFTDAEVSEIVSNVLCLVLKEYKEIIGEK